MRRRRSPRFVRADETTTPRPGPGTDRCRGRLALGILAAITFGAGCAGDRDVDAPTDPVGIEPIELRWVVPVEGDSVAGRVRLEVEPSGPPGIERIVFYADGYAVDTLYTAPWIASWHVGPSAAVRPAMLRADVWSDLGYRYHSPGRRVWLVPDAPPRVGIEGAGGGSGFLRSRFPALRASACDPETGPIESGSIWWEIEGLPEPVPGDEISTEWLPDVGSLRLRAAARDLRGNEARSQPILLFDYVSVAEPADLLENVARAWTAADLPTLAAALAPEFRFVPCGTESDGSNERAWSGTDLMERIERWRDSGRWAGQWSWRPVPAVSTEISSWFLADSIEVRVYDPTETEERGRTGTAARCPPGRVERVHRFQARVEIVRHDGDFRIRRWVDVHGATGDSWRGLLSMRK